MFHQPKVAVIRIVILLGLLAFSCEVLSQEKQGTPIRIVGVEKSLEENIAAHLELVDEKIPLSLLGFPRSNEFILRKARSALQALGYYQPNLRLEGDHNEWTLFVEPGNPTVWNTIAIEFTEGKSHLPDVLIELLNKTPIVKGKRIDHGTYESFKSKVESTAYEHGFMSVKFIRSTLEVNIEERQANVNWLIQLGPQYRINELELVGSDLSQPFLSRFIRIQRGEPYQLDRIIQTQQRLNRSGYFSSVSLNQSVDEVNKLVSLQIELVDQKKYELKTTLGYGTDSGGRAGVSWQDKRVNKEGHNYQLNADVSEINLGTSFVYRIPLDVVGSEWLNRAAFRIKDDAVSRSKISSLESRLVLKESDFWSQQFGIMIASEEVTNNDVIENYLEYLVPTWQVDYYSTSDPFRATEGWHWQSTVRLGNESLSDPDLNFVQWEQRLKWIYPLNDNWRFLSKTQIGITDMDQEEFVTRMPTSYRFFAGGDTSVRGYDYQTLAPVDDNGQVIGGRYLATQSLEIDWQFSSDWRWAWFVDAGNAFNESNRFEIKRAAGTGIRWVTPVGSIRLDFAKALDDTKEWRWHITIGPDL